VRGGKESPGFPSSSRFEIKPAAQMARRRIVLQLDNAGWHGPENLTVPDGIKLVFQPAHSPELQPAEHLWTFVDEPRVNRHFKTIEHLDQAVAERCVALTQQQDLIRDRTFFHWWPRLEDHTATRK
jgi:transposase